MKALALLAMLLGAAGPAWARQEQEAPDQDPAALTKVAPEIDATKLGVSLPRILRQLGLEEVRDNAPQDTLRLQYNVQVFGTAPKIEVLKGVDLFNGPVPGSAPTHQQYIEYATPYMYRLPALPVSAAAAWVGQWMWQKSKKTRCEEEIENYRALVMQGVNVSAPRCTQ
jgi:hypothetical protein